MRLYDLVYISRENWTWKQHEANLGSVSERGFSKLGVWAWAQGCQNLRCPKQSFLFPNRESWFNELWRRVTLVPAFWNQKPLKGSLKSQRVNWVFAKPAFWSGSLLMLSWTINHAFSSRCRCFSPTEKIQTRLISILSISAMGNMRPQPLINRLGAWGDRLCDFVWACRSKWKKAGQVASIYDWRALEWTTIYYGSPLVTYAYLYVCVCVWEAREEHHHLYGSSISLSASLTT